MDASCVYGGIFVVVMALLMFGVQMYANMPDPITHTYSQASYSQARTNQYGEFIGYKVLVKTESVHWDAAETIWVSPITGSVWDNDEMDQGNNQDGIYAFKSPKDKGLVMYMRGPNRHVVEVFLSGEVNETDFGYVASHAKISREIGGI